jgi:hypothetical protein
LGTFKLATFLITAAACTMPPSSKRVKELATLKHCVKLKKKNQNCLTLSGSLAIKSNNIPL